MATTPPTAFDRVTAGHQALAQGDWLAARECFEAALALEESGEAYEGLAWALWYVAEAEPTLGARENAYRAYRAGGDQAGAGRTAAWLATDLAEYRGDEAAARGWMERAHRLLDELPESVDHGWLAACDVSLGVDSGERAAELGAFAAGIGRRHGVADLEAIGLSQEGLALIRLGRADEGMRRLDESAAVVAGEDFRLPMSPAWALCCSLSACAGIGDFPRAAQWCEAMREWAERWGARQMMGQCRTVYGRVLATSGDWAAAESELLAAVDDLEAARPGMAAGGIVRLAELRARQGHLDQARRLLERAGSHGLATVGLGELALHAGDPASAADAAERALRRLPATSVLERLPALELLARAGTAAGEPERARAASAEVQATAERIATPYLRGRAAHVAADVAAAQGDDDGARRSAEDAIDAFAESAAPYEGALARLVLARALASLGRGERAMAEAHAAREVFVSLGAARDIGIADALLAGAEDTEPRRAATAELTARELEVLRLVAQGLSDAEIAERLVVSPHTVHRHVANARAKLRLPSRAAAVAYAARSGLL